MKNKKLTYYILIPAVLVVWGLIIYKIVMRDNDQIRPTDLSGYSKKAQSVIGKSTYQLLNNYPDPFSGGHTITVEKSVGKQEIVKPKIEKKWSVIRFNGYILNGNKVKCHLTIDGDDKILQVHEKILGDYIVSMITPDSVEIKYQGSSRWFKK